MAETLRDWSDQLLVLAFLLLPSALLLDAAILGIATYALWRPHVLRRIRKWQQLRALKKPFGVTIAQGDWVLEIGRMSGKNYVDSFDEEAERVRAHGWPYRPDQPQERP